MSFDSIAKKFGQALISETPARRAEVITLYCLRCEEKFEGNAITTGCPTCGDSVEEWCERCECNGFVMSSYQEHPPNFEDCPDCENPNQRQSP